MISRLLLPTVIAIAVLGTSSGFLRAAPPSALADLDWMIGEWKHESEGATITMTARWSEGGHFLLREFAIVLGKEEPLRLTQTVYWDAVNKEVRSWGFASDGSVETGRWVLEDNKVLVQREMIYPDGKQGTAINQWDLADPTQCVFSSLARKVDGEKIPDIAPTELERKKAGR